MDHKATPEAIENWKPNAATGDARLLEAGTPWSFNTAASNLGLMADAPMIARAAASS
jgi:hypothetical protein